MKILGKSFLINDAVVEGHRIATRVKQYGRETIMPWEYVSDAASTISVAIIVGAVIIARAINPAKETE